MSEMKTSLQLILEQQVFELCRSTYLPMFFNSKYYSATDLWLNLRLWRKCEYQGPTISYIWIFRCRGLHP